MKSLIRIALGLFILLLGESKVFAQNDISINLSSGYSFSKNDSGYNYGADFKVSIYRQFNVGLFINNANFHRQRDVENLIEWRIFEVIVNGLNDEDMYLRDIRNVSQNHIGLNIGYLIVDHDKFNVECSLGYGITRHQYVQFTENFTDPSNPFLSQYSSHTITFDRNWGLSACYTIAKKYNLGVRLRLIEGPIKDVSTNAFFGIRI